MFEKPHPTISTCPAIIEAPAILAFRAALLVNSQLRFLDIGLAEQVYTPYAELLKVEDKTVARMRWMLTKLAFISTLSGCRRDSHTDSPEGKRARSSLPSLPLKQRRRLVSPVLQFIRPPLSCDVAVVKVPRL